MSLSTSYGFNTLLKEGHKHFSGLEEALIKNINAVKEISNITRTSLGPNDKIFVTSDAATIMRELEVQHPAAKMVVMASKMQESECGDGTNFVLSFCGELLNQAESLIKMGLHPSQIVSGYEHASKRACELLQKMTCFEVTDASNVDQVQKALKSSLSSKLSGYSTFFAGIVAQACSRSLPAEKNTFDIDHIRVVKILGGSLEDSYSMQGMVISRGTEGTISRVSQPKIAVYGIPLDPQQCETKATVLIKNADELLNYTKSEEEHAEKIVKKIAEAGATCIIVGGTISELMLHYIEKYRMMVVKLTSKFELKRVCKAINANAVTRLDAPLPEEIGYCDEIYVKEIGSHKVVVIKKETSECRLNTIVLRGSTNNLLDDVERAIDDGVNVFKCLIKDGRFVPGAGSAETILSYKLQQEAKALDDLSQYSFNRYALSFETIPRILAENSGLKSNEVITTLISKNSVEGNVFGINTEKGEIQSVKEFDVYDHLESKWWALKLATDAAITLLKVDQIIIAKPAGGPKLGEKKGDWDQD